ncbi:hypothetical protein ACHAW5_002977 [Stephanodiscus triporus]|uniref:C2H2-type domain-containing protein n=1 Tax=Stephanodiscus triporus TaxID=2934178 RepID=A0ABD3PGE1_9STRA
MPLTEYSLVNWVMPLALYSFLVAMHVTLYHPLASIGGVLYFLAAMHVALYLLASIGGALYFLVAMHVTLYPLALIGGALYLLAAMHVALYLLASIGGALYLLASIGGALYLLASIGGAFLPHLGYDASVPERVCSRCKSILDARDLEEHVLWHLTPYFETGMDTYADVACQLARPAISLARSIPLGAQAYIAIETAEVLRKHGLKGVCGLLLRKEFLAAADLLVHELSAVIFYALVQHRALRGLRPEWEELIHLLRPGEGDDDVTAPPLTTEGGRRTSRNDGDSRPTNPPLPVLREDPMADDADIEDLEAGDTIMWEGSSRDYLAGEFSESVLDETDIYDPDSEKVVDVLAISTEQDRLPFNPVCEHLPDALISSLLFFAPLALDFIDAECKVDMQLLAAQQGWRLVYASLDQNHQTHAGNNNDLEGNDHFSDKPASALFAHDEHKIACLSIRGTATIQDVEGEEEEDQNGERNSYSSRSLDESEEWTSGLVLLVRVENDDDDAVVLITIHVMGAPRRCEREGK